MLPITAYHIGFFLYGLINDPMGNTLIDYLNKILTNALEYGQLLKELAESVADKATSQRLQELANVKKKHSEKLTTKR